MPNCRDTLDRLEDRIFAIEVAQVIAWFAFLGGIAGWPLTAITIFKDEPQGILGLSWIAIIYTGFQILQNMHQTKTLEKKMDDA